MKGRFTLDSGLIDSFRAEGIDETEEELRAHFDNLPIKYETNEVKPRDEVDFRVDIAESTVDEVEVESGGLVKVPDYHLIPSMTITCYENKDPRVRFVYGFRDLVTVEFHGKLFSLHYYPR